MPRVAVMSDAFGGELLMDLPEERFFWTPSTGLPTSEQLAEMDVTIVLGQLANAGVAVQLSGIARLALQRSKKTLVFAYPAHVEGADEEFLNDLSHALPSGNRTNAVFDYPSEFHAYFTEYGRSGAGFLESEVESARVIGWIRASYGYRIPTALCWEHENLGVLYVLPYFLSGAGSPARMVAALYGAVSAHRDLLAVGLPSYLADVRLGAVEVSLLAVIDDMETAVAAKKAEASELARWRHLIGRTSGTPLVELAVDALNFVLDGSDHRAETRADVRVEDFWIVGPQGDFALAEAKGVAGGIARGNVSQVDSHREERSLPPEFPGLLIVNGFRGDADLTRKQDEEVAPNVVALARTQNVLIMRTWDVFQLVARKLNGENVEETIVDALQDAQGGWLRVDENGVTIVR